MSSSDVTSPPARKGDPRFHTTHWSMVLAAADRRRADSPEALAQLCQSYWYPVYAFIRRRVADAHAAQDLTQEFFSCLLDKNYLNVVQEERGRFRTFLRTAVHRFLGKQWAKTNALKRGGRNTTLSLDFAWGESRLALEPALSDNPEREFDRQWALQLLEVVGCRLRQEYAVAGKQPLYDQLQPLLTGHGEAARYDEIGRALGMTAGAVKTAVYRMRRRYRKLLRDEIAQTVTCEEDLDDEVRGLFAALA